MQNKHLLRILFIADIYGIPGRRATHKLLPSITERFDVDFVIANGENIAGGFGITKPLARKLISYGVNIITSGNHFWDRQEIHDELDNIEYLLRPANFPETVPGKGYTVIELPEKCIQLGIINLQGRVFMPPIDCPFQKANSILHKIKNKTNVIFVDFHAEATSEKKAMGCFLDGRVSAVVGTHTHIQTADECILPNGTAYITDAGMTGPHDSVIGVKKEAVIEHFLKGVSVRFSTAQTGVRFEGVIVDIDTRSGEGHSIQRISTPLETQSKSQKEQE